MYERFSDRARKVMQLANQEAQRFGKEFISPEHLLLGICKEGGGVAANVLKNLGVQIGTIRAATEAVLGRPDSGKEIIIGRLPHTPGAKKAIELAIEEARNLLHNYVGTEHLLLGLAALSVLPGESCATMNAVFTKLSLTSEKIRNGVRELLSDKTVPQFNEIGIPIMATTASEMPTGETRTFSGGKFVAAPAFSVGDVVRLKSGGPAMTVTTLLPDGRLNLFGFFQVDCEWKSAELAGIDPKAVTAF